MGYYTNYSLSILEGNDPNIDYEYEIGEISGYGESTFEEDIKWYNHTKDMINISKKYPNTVFALKGIGEESDDMWIRYFKDGKCQAEDALISFPNYDKSKLK
jgi:hypothetical protein